MRVPRDRGQRVAAQVEKEYGSLHVLWGDESVVVGDLEVLPYTVPHDAREPLRVLDDELDFVRAYLEVERARFGDRLETDVHLDDAVRGARVPTMMVQTLVENAVKHGVASVRGRASVTVTAREESGHLVMSVADNGPGFAFDSLEPPLAQSMPTRGGYGLVNIRQRLEGYFGSKATLSVDRSGGLTTVSVALPLLRQEPRAQQPQEIAR